MPRREMLSRMSATELDEYMLYAQIEPIAEPWRQTGQLASVLANVNRDAKKQPDPFTPEDFMPIARTESRPMTDAEIDAAEAEAERIAAWKAQARAARGR